MYLDADRKVCKTVAVRCYPGIRVVFYEVVVDTCPPSTQSTVVTGTIDPGEYGTFVQMVMDLAATVDVAEDNLMSDRLRHILVLEDESRVVVDLPLNRAEESAAVRSLMEIVDRSFVGDALLRADTPFS